MADSADKQQPRPMLPAIEPRERPDVLTGSTVRIRDLHQTNLYITLTALEDGSIFECFTNRANADPCSHASQEAISRLISLCLRSGIAPKEIVRQLKGIACCPVFDVDHPGNKYLSEPDAIAQVLERAISD